MSNIMFLPSVCVCVCVSTLHYGDQMSTPVIFDFVGTYVLVPMKKQVLYKS